MRSTLLEIASVFVASALVAVTAQATNLAGWDFSQYAADGALSIDGSTYTSTLDANYSDQDGTSNAGAESAAFGTLYMDGSFGSSSISAGSGSEEVVPVATDILLNLDRDTPVTGTNGFNSFSILEGEGQPFAERMGLTARAAAQLVFEADLSGTASAGTGHSVSFAGKALVDADCYDSCSSDVSVEFSTDGASYTSYGSVSLTDEEQEFSVPFALESAQKAYVRLGFNPTSGQPVIDNVAINAIAVPEPGAMLQLASSIVTLIGLAALRRRA